MYKRHDGTEVGSDRREFIIEVMYFKENGKYYTEDTVTLVCSNVGQYSPNCDMDEAVDQIKCLQRDKMLPGLRSGEWWGPILVNCSNGYPVLLLPDKKVDLSS